MPIGRGKIVRCKKLLCRHKFMVVIGDVFPLKITCPKCGYSWIYQK